MRLSTLLFAALFGRAAVAAPPAPDASQQTAAAETPDAETPDAETPDAEAAAEPSKKERTLADKAARKRIHARRAPSVMAHLPLTVRNMWTHEVLPLDPISPPPETAIDDLLRDHFTNQATQMDPRLASVILKAASKFKASFVEVVSGYRAPKYNLMLRKKGHAVARESQHPLGHAVDFRLAGVATRQLYKFVRSLHLGGVGYYPHNGFVHADVGPIRTWKGE